MTFFSNIVLILLIYPLIGIIEIFLKSCIISIILILIQLYVILKAILKLMEKHNDGRKLYTNSLSRNFVIILLQAFNLYFWIAYLYKYPFFHSFLMSYDPVFHLKMIKNLHGGVIETRYPIVMHLAAYALAPLTEYNP